MTFMTLMFFKSVGEISCIISYSDDLLLTSRLCKNHFINALMHYQSMFVAFVTVLFTWYWTFLDLFHALVCFCEHVSLFESDSVSIKLRPRFSAGPGVGALVQIRVSFNQTEQSWVQLHDPHPNWVVNVYFNLVQSWYIYHLKEDPDTSAFENHFLRLCPSLKTFIHYVRYLSLSRLIQIKMAFWMLRWSYKRTNTKQTLVMST